MNRYFLRVKYTSGDGNQYVFPCTVEAASEPEARTIAETEFADMYPKATINQVVHHDTVRNIGRYGKRSTLVG